jgi:hypothetical protein
MGQLVGRLAAVALWAVADEVRRHEFVQNADPRFGRSRMAFQRFRAAVWTTRINPEHLAEIRMSAGGKEATRVRLMS